MLYKSARPIPDRRSYEFIKKNINGKNIYKKHLPKDFCQGYFDWILQTKLNYLYNLDKFKSKQFVHGTAQSFDFFYMDNHTRRFRCFKGDFMYHQIMWKRGYNWSFIEDGDIEENDAVIFSVPFSDFGDIHPETNNILYQCDKLNVPVFVDCAYMVMSKDITFDFGRDCIKGASFSMSKGFYGAEHLRIGLRLTEKFTDDSVEVFNQFEMINWIGPDVGLKLIDEFHTDYIQDKYSSSQKKACDSLFITPTKCAIFGLAGKNHPQFSDNNRGTDARRVCISSLIGDMKDLQAL